MRWQTGLKILLLLGIGVAVSAGVVTAVEQSDSIDSTAVSPVGSQAQMSLGEGSLGGSSAATSDDLLIRNLTFKQLPDEAGQISVEMAFTVPDQIVELKTGISRNTTVTATEGFEPTGEGNYSWDGETERPSVTLSLVVNRTGSYHLKPNRIDRATSTDPGFTFVDTGDWAIASVPSASVYWTANQNSPRVEFIRETAVEGEGVAGNRMVFLGAHSKMTRDIDGQSVTLVVPDTANLNPEGTAILDSLQAASSHLPSSPVETSIVIAAPTSVNWGPFGLADRSDTWVRANESIDTPNNVWLHEFVHLRQDFRTDTDARWIREGMPEYYAALLALDQGRVDFGTFSDHLDRATSSRYEHTILSEPDSWDYLGNYVKGGLVFGTIDHQVRVDSSGTYTVRNLFEAMNARESRIDQAFIESQIESMTSTSTVTGLRPYMSTTDTPSMWSHSEHQSAFGTDPPAIQVSVTESVKLTGPYRNQSGETIPTVVPGESLSFPVSVSNEGGSAGTYNVSLTVDDQVVAYRTGTLAANTTETVSLTYTFEATGTRTVAIESTSWFVTVEEPAAPNVSSITVSDELVAPEETITITGNVSNPSTKPANGTIRATFDGEQIASWPIMLGPSETVEAPVSIAPTETGSHQITVGSKTVNVQVQSETTTTSSLITTESTDTTSERTSSTVTGPITSDSPGTANETTTLADADGTSIIETPGFTLGQMLFALIVLGGWISRRSE